MNFGAKVPPASMLLRAEFERIRLVSLRAGIKAFVDWVREWDFAFGGDSEDERLMDCGRLDAGAGVGEGDAEPLLNGLALQRGPF